MTVTSPGNPSDHPMTRIVSPLIDAGSGAMSNLFGSFHASFAICGVTPCLRRYSPRCNQSGNSSMSPM